MTLREPDDGHGVLSPAQLLLKRCAYRTPACGDLPLLGGIVVVSIASVYGRYLDPYTQRTSCPAPKQPLTPSILTWWCLCLLAFLPSSRANRYRVAGSLCMTLLATSDNPLLWRAVLRSTERVLPIRQKPCSSYESFTPIMLSSISLLAQTPLLR